MYEWAFTFHPLSVYGNPSQTTTQQLLRRSSGCQNLSHFLWRDCPQCAPRPRVGARTTVEKNWAFGLCVFARLSVRRAGVTFLRGEDLECPRLPLLQFVPGCKVHHVTAFPILHPKRRYGGRGLREEPFALLAPKTFRFPSPPPFLLSG